MSLNGTTVEQQIWNFLKAEGFNDYGVAGLMGNLFAESGLISNNMENTYQTRLGYSDIIYTKAVDNGTYTNFVKDSVGYGLAQWTYWTRKQNLLDYAKSKNKSIGDLEMQLEFLVRELKQSYASSVYEVLKNATSVLEASNAVLLNFERPADTSAAVQERRADYGLNYYNKYKSQSSGNKQPEKQIKEYKKGQQTQVSKNFMSTEFDCNGTGCCNTTLLDKKLVEYLQAIRNHFGKPINITSAYRCENHNKKSGGATKSYHTRGQAADIVVQGISSREVAKYAESIGILGIGLYETSKDGYFTHIDTRTTKAFWYGQNEEPRSTFANSTSSSGAGSKNEDSANYHKSTSKYTVNLIYLQLNDRGRDVQILQELLKIRGYQIEASGIFDQHTKKAVIDFQKKTKIPADGIVGSQTMEKLLTV